jgi:hypothetical protein
MALKAILTKAEYDTLPELLREQYGADGDSFVLDADIDAHPKLAGLKSALAKERQAKKDGDAEFRKLRDQIGDLDPEQARAALNRVQEMADKKMLDEGKVDELIKARTDAMAKSHAAEKTAYEKKLAEIDAERTSLNNEVTTLILDGSIRERSSAARVKPEHYDDVLYRMKDRGVDGVKWTLGEGRKVVAMQGEEPKFGKDAQPMSLDEGLEMLRKSVPGFFEPSSGGGAHNSARQEGNRFVISENDARDHGKWKAASDAAKKAGQELAIRPSQGGM